ncbi:amidohydrolase family protein [Nakamurella sp. YIM 132087]|uniref:Amidohydrolase family protein n=1 Tax=Nakamurella alba TaxID=2665158 RepID=A0A7K1FRQ0_9ACTN|nr:amidohydrolase family protein [Nakamurella alba]MTD16822.1 amidohydrolase family protein [Nakamurella alba]
MTTVLLRGGRVHTPADPDATAIAVTDGQISWIGGEHGIAAAGHADQVIDLDGLLVVPGFVDAHVHATDAGLAITGLDLTGTTSLADCLTAVSRFAAAHPDGVLWGHGWDESTWPERRTPTTAELDAAVGRRAAYLSRRDVHSALASSVLRADTRGLDDAAGHHPDLPVTMAAHHLVRNRAKELLTTEQRRSAQLALLEKAAAQGIVEVHECAAGDDTGRADLAALLALDGPIPVRGYLAAAVTDPAEATALLAATGAHALGGDLSVDGAIGSRTASLSAPYTDAAHIHGTRYLSDEEILEHLVACARAGIQPGFHAIGDDAVSAVAAGLTRAAERLGGTVALAAVTPRIEHAEMIDAAAIAALAATGAVASVQSVFDELWGGPDGMYAERLGERWTPMNPFAALASAGVPLALGSDAPVTPVDPWRAVRAAVHHRTAGAGISPRAAFTAHTRGGHRAAGRIDRGIGSIVVGAPAHLAIVRAGELIRPIADAAVARWSTDPRSRVPLLPDLGPGNDLPETVATLVAGRPVFDAGLFTG